MPEYRDNKDPELQLRWQDAAESWFNRPVRVTDAAGSVTGLHRPGFRVSHLAGNGDSVRNLTMDGIYAAYDTEISEMWKIRATDAADSVTGLHRPSGLRATRMPANGDSLRSLTMDEIYTAYDAEISEMWKSSR